MRAVEGMKSLPATTVDVAHPPGRVLAGGTPVDLREALPHLPGPALSLEALRKHAQRDDRFPEPAGEVNGAGV